MGNQDLLPLLGSRVKTISVKDQIPSGSRVALDGSVPAHAALDLNYTTASKGEFGAAISSFCDQVRAAMSWSQNSLRWLIVFDGQRLRWKLSLTSRKEAAKGVQQPEGWGTTREWEGSPEHLKALKAQARALAHRMSSRFVVHMVRACRQLGVPFIVAPAEAEHQLVHLNLTGQVDYIVLNDSDVVLAADQSKPHSSPVRAIIVSGGLCGRTARYYDAGTILGDGASSSYTPGTKTCKVFDELIKAHGYSGLVAFGLANNNDYNVGLLPGIGSKTAAQAALEALNKSGGEPLKKLRPLAKALGSLRVKRKSAQEPTEDDILGALERARLMYHHQPVYDLETKRITTTTPIVYQNYEVFSEAEIKEQLGHGLLDGLGLAGADAAKVCEAAAYDLGASPPALRPTPAPAAAPAAAQAQAPRACAPRHGAAPDRFKSQTDLQLKEWLHERKFTRQDTAGLDHDGLLRLVDNAFSLGLDEKGEGEDLDALAKMRYERDMDLYANVLNPTRQLGFELDVAAQDPKCPVLEPRLIEKYFKRKRADTLRNRCQGETRAIVRFFMYKDVDQSEIIDGVKHDTWLASAVISLSIPGTTSSAREQSQQKRELGHAGRVVVAKLRALGAGKEPGIVTSIEACE